jgi:hypothetical protein
MEVNGHVHARLLCLLGKNSQRRFRGYGKEKNFFFLPRIENIIHKHAKSAIYNNRGICVAFYKKFKKLTPVLMSRN